MTLVIAAIWLGLALWHDWGGMSEVGHVYYEVVLPAMALLYAVLWLKTRREEK